MSTADDIVAELRRFARLYSLNSIFVVGGYPRSKVLGDKEDVKDIDVASAYPSQSIILCGLFASEVLHVSPERYHRTETAFIKYKDIKIEFQNGSVNAYMHNEDIINWMHKRRIDNTPLINNIYGRDFTINSLILSLKNGEIYDLTHRAVEDLDKKHIKTILPAAMALRYNPIIALRAIRFACKYKFIIDPELRKLIVKSIPLLVKSYSKERIEKEIEKIIQTDIKEGLEQLANYQMTSLVLPERLKKYIRLEEKK